MFLKLMALDFRFGCKKFFAIAAIVLVFGLIFPFVENTDIGSIASVMLILSVWTVMVACVIITLQHFSKNLFGDEGYFMHTLPVNPTLLLASKVVTTLVWFYFMIVVGMMMFMLLLRYNMDWFQYLFVEMSFSELKMFARVMFQFSMIVLTIIMSSFMGVTMSTATVKKRALGIFVGLAIAAVALIIFWSVVNEVTDQTSAMVYVLLEQEGVEAIINGSNFVTLWIPASMSAVYSAVCFAITSLLMKYKLNLR